ncbi:MAG: hypothetical protein HC769_35310 [Cyanobacteria bacterium CRU_2_1]|nr:hypothetical protein [Cyanobacteria bacterium CRU_2_1]
MNSFFQTENCCDRYRPMTGGEYHAYLFHHYLNHRFVIPIPDLWMLLLAALVGKFTQVCLQQQSSVPCRSFLILSGSTILYGILSLELYLSPMAILLPIALPTITFWLYIAPVLVQRK